MPRQINQYATAGQVIGGLKAKSDPTRELDFEAMERNGQEIKDNVDALLDTLRPDSPNNFVGAKNHTLAEKVRAIRYQNETKSQLKIVRAAVPANAEAVPANA